MTRATDLWGEWQKYGARGLSGGTAMSQELDRIVKESGIKSPPATDRGIRARLNYLDSTAGRTALKNAGVSPRTLRSWKRGGVTPSARSREKIDAAYQTRRRENLITSGALKKRLNRDGQGTRVEIYPVNQQDVPERRTRPNVQDRSIQARYVWDDAVDAWAAGDTQLMDEIWADIIADLDSDWAAYAYVGALSLGA